MGCIAPKPTAPTKDVNRDPVDVLRIPLGISALPPALSPTTPAMSATVTISDVRQQNPEVPRVGNYCEEAEKLRQCITAVCGEWSKDESRDIESVHKQLEVIQSILYKKAWLRNRPIDDDIPFLTNLASITIGFYRHQVPHPSETERLKLAISIIYEILLTKYLDYLLSANVQEFVSANVQEFLNDVLVDFDIDEPQLVSAITQRKRIAAHRMRKRVLAIKNDNFRWEEEMILRNARASDPLRVAVTLLSCILHGYPDPEFYTAATCESLASNSVRVMEITEDCLWTLVWETSEFRGGECDDVLSAPLPMLMDILRNPECSPTIMIPALEYIVCIVLDRGLVKQPVDLGFLDVIMEHLDWSDSLVLCRASYFVEVLANSPDHQSLFRTHIVALVAKVVSVHFSSIMTGRAREDRSRWVCNILSAILPCASDSHIQEILRSVPIIAVLTDLWTRGDYTCYTRSAFMMERYFVTPRTTMRELVDNIFAHTAWCTLAVQRRPLVKIVDNVYYLRDLEHLPAVWALLAVAMGDDIYQLHRGTPLYRFAVVYECLRHLRVMTLLVATTTLTRFQRVFRAPLSVDIYLRLRKYLIGLEFPRISEGR